MRVLIIEDEENIALPLQKGLKSQGFVADVCLDGPSGLQQAEINGYDCILLDLNLPGIDGLEVADKLRAQEIFTPIIMLTARSQQYDKLKGFDTGADDYVTKPFDFKELVARIHAVVKRNSNNKSEKLTCSIGELLPERGVIITVEKEVELTSKEISLLEYLIRNKGNFVATEEILEHVWGDEVDVFSDTVKTHVKNLRKKLGAQAIVSKRSQGYKVD